MSELGAVIKSLADLDSLLNSSAKTIQVKQIKGSAGKYKDQKQTLIGLGLRGNGSTSDLICSQSSVGMLKKVFHLIEVRQVAS